MLVVSAFVSRRMPSSWIARTWFLRKPPFQRHFPKLYASSFSFPSLKNQELVQEQLRDAQGKKQARKASTLELVQRHLEVKKSIQERQQSLVAIRVSVCPELRQELKLNGRERRGRLFVPLLQENIPKTQTIFELKQELHAFFRCLRKGTYCMSASLQARGEDKSSSSWPIETDSDVMETFAKALAHYEKQQQQQDNDKEPILLKRPTINLYISKDPNAPPPEQLPEYVQTMANPLESPTITMLSFYAFGSIPKPHDFGRWLKGKFKPFHAKGRIYVSPTEGINAQMSVPTNVLAEFTRYCQEEIPELGNRMENGINVDPKPLSTTNNDDVCSDPPPFSNLHVRVRNQIVADGLSKALDWSNAGYDMPPMEWHESLEKKRKQPNDNSMVLLDCRNLYESSVGTFVGAEPLETENFRDSWQILQTKLKDAPKDTPIYTYCTGGIRCVKVGAYLKQEMNFTNVNRLAGGIIAYDRTLNSSSQEQKESLFKGTNFVFDGRLSRQITKDELGQCRTCGDKTSLVSNCQNPNCHLRMIQCETCRTSYHGTCCEACKQRIMGRSTNNNNSLMSSKRNVLKQQQQQQEQNQQASALELVQDTADAVEEEYHTLEDYSSGHSTPTPSFFEEMELNTRDYMPLGSHMVSGAAQGQFLKFLASMTAQGRILEIGTFTGYATACLIEGAAAAAASSVLSSSSSSSSSTTIGGRQAGPFVQTMERDGRAMDLAVAHLKVMADLGTVSGQEAAEAACRLRSKDGRASSVEEDSVFLTYQNRVGCEVLRVTDALATLEEMAMERADMVDPPEPFDMVFVDADKTRLLEYVEACVASDTVLKKGGLIVVDNVLWKGLVLQANNGGKEPVTMDGESEQQKKKGRRARKLATKMHRFNAGIVKDSRVEVMVLPMRDGLSVIRKR